MKHPIRIAAIALAAICVTAPATQAVAQAPVNPQIEVSYVRPTNRNYQSIYERLQNRHVLEDLRRLLAPVKLPRKLTVKLDECRGQQRSPYRPGGPVTICYELVDRIEKVGAKVDASDRPVVVAGAFIQALLHELSYAMFDLLQVPVWGRASDAADRLSALVMIKFGEDVAKTVIIGSAMFLAASDRTWTGSEFADTLSPDDQRFYNYLCIAYGGSPIAFRYLTTGTPPAIPAARARRCPSEYREVLSAFNLRIMPHVDADLLLKVRATPWLLSTDLK
jgi:hypothetical protein